ncbi:MAG TPA: YegS/Rv2252/BmrU family lipid kinase [Actinobacteria bacterium]|nr:YegS/Rv2252/BmrU family lipid kinase [Actinomycetota bacterium]
MTWVVVRNPHAGWKTPSESDIEMALNENGIAAEIHTTTTADHAAGIVATAHAEGRSRFIVAGGDGTLHGLINAILSHDWPRPPTVGVLPLGSGSDFLRTFAIPQDWRRAMTHLVGEERYLCDAGHIEGGFGHRYFVNVADVGVAGAAVKWSNRLPRFFGKLRYTGGFWIALAGFPPREVTVDTGRRTINATAVNIVIANGQFFGGGMNIAPQAALTDGLLDIEVFTGRRRQAFTVMPRVIKGLHLRHASVRTARTARAVITCPANWPVEADGELLGSGPVTISVVPGAFYLKI